MRDSRKAAIQIIIGLLVGVIGVVSTLLLLSPEASVGPMLQGVDPDLSIIKSDGRDPVVAGTGLTYTLVVTNNGPHDASGVVVTDDLPTGVTFITATLGQGTCGELGGVVTCTLPGTLTNGAGTVGIITVTVNPSMRGMLTNTAGVTATQPDTNTVNNRATQTTMVEAEADLLLTKMDDPDLEVIAGETLTYTITVTNEGPSNATGVRVTDTLPLSVVFGAAIPSQGSYSEATGVWSVGPLTDSYSATLIITTTVRPSTTGSLSNVAEASAVELDRIPGDNTAAEGTEVDTEADLSINKLDDPDPVINGGVLTYTLAITNHGPSDAVDVAVTDTLPASVTFDSAVPSGGGSCGQVGGVVTCSFGSLPRGDVATVTIGVVVDLSVAHGTTLTNLAEVAAATFDVDLLDNETTEGTAVNNEIDLEVAKVVDDATPDEGDVVEYTVTITNGDPDDATGVVLTDTLPAGVSYVSHTVSVGGYSSGNGRWEVGELTGGNVATLVITATVDVGTGGDTITNTTEGLSADQTDPDGSDNSDSAVITVQSADLEVDKFVSQAPVVAGSNLTYTLVVTNSGPHDAVGVVLTDALPAEVTFVASTPGSPTCVESSGAVTCTLGTLAVSDSTLVTIVVGIPSSVTGMLTNVAGVAAVTSDPDTSNNTAVEETPVDVEADLAIAKSAGTDSVVAGAPLSYTLVVTNNGPSDAVGVTVTDTLPAEADMGSSSAGCVYHAAEHHIICDVGLLTVGNTATVTASVTVTSPLPNGTILTNTATVGGDQTDPVGGNNVAQVQTTVESAPVLDLAKHGGPDPVEAGARLVYTLTYTNTGNEIATNTVITDVLDENVTYFDASPPAQGSGRTRYWPIDYLAPDGPHQIMITVTVRRPLTNGTTLTNVAWLDSDQTAPLSATQETTVSSRPVLTITKVDDRDPVETGWPLGYTIVITNSGNENATHVTVTEHYDPNVSFDSAVPGADPGSEGRVWTFPSLAVDESETIDIVVEVTDTLPVGTVLTNQAVLDSDQTTSVTITETTAVTSASKLQVYKWDLPSTVPAGENLVYVIHYQASGSAPAEDVIITETYDSRLAFVFADPSPITGTNNVWDIGYLAVDEGGDIMVTMHVTSPLPNGAILTNQVTIDSAYTSPLSDTETTRVSSAPDLTLDVLDRPDPVAPGDPLTYTLRYTNAGNADATNVVVTATLDSDVSYVTATPTPTGGTDDLWYWEIDEIPGEGGHGEILIGTAVTLPLPNGTILDFTAQLADAEGDFLENTAQTTVTSAPILHIHKSAGASTVDAGSLLTYTLTYSNTGSEIASSVVITDLLDPNAAYDGASITPSVMVSDTLFGWAVGSLTPTVSGRITLTVRVRSPLPNNTILTNTASIGSEQTSPVWATETATVRSAPVLHLTKIDSHDPADAGSILTYTIVYSNTGNEIATNVVVTDFLDGSVTFLSASPPPDGGVGQDTPYWSIDSLAPEAPGQIILRVTIASPLWDGTKLSNVASIDSDQTDPQSTQENTEVQSAPVLQLTKTGTPDPVDAGAILTYELLYANVGNETATQVVITDVLDPNVSFLSSSPSPDGGVAENAPYWTMGNLAPTGPGQITLRVIVTRPLANGTVITNVASIDCDRTGSSSVTETTTVRSAPVLSLHKSNSVAFVRAGDRLTYTIAYTNSGNENASGITITDTLPMHVEYVDCEIEEGSCQLVQPGEVIFDIPTLIVDSSGQARVVVEVDAPLPLGTYFITNHVRMMAPSLPAPVEFQEVDPIALPDLMIDVDHEPSLFSPGERMTYTVDYDNRGLADAENVVITTTLPPGTTYVDVGQGWQSSGGIYTYTVGDLPRGMGRQIHFVVRHPDQSRIGAPEFDTPFAIRSLGTDDMNFDDNTNHTYIGVPDLVVTSFTVEPYPVRAGVPVSFTVVVENQGTGTAWNPDNSAGFWVDIFFGPVASYPFDRDGDLWGDPEPMPPGSQDTVILVHGGFTRQEISGMAFYAKVDNHQVHPYGLVPEHNEQNNVAGPIYPWPYRIYIPLTVR